MVPVNVYIRNFNSPPDPVAGVLVHVYDAEGTTLIASSTTNEFGQAGFLLPGSQAYGGTEYQLRFYKIGLRIDSPQYIQVLEPAEEEVNDFDVQAHDLNESEEAHDDRFCRMYTTLIDNSGQVVCNARLSFRLTRHPVVLSDAMMLAQDTEVYSDRNGKVVVDLIRGGTYTATLPGFEESLVDEFDVPDAPSWELTKVLFPYPLRLEFDPPDDLHLTVGKITELGVTAYLSDGRVLENGEVYPWIDVYASENVVMLQYFGEGKLRITAKSAGTCTLSARVRESAVDARIPVRELVVDDIEITVV